MDFVGAIKAGFQNYVNFRGTATRPEFWYWFLFTFLVGLVTSAFPVLSAIGTVFSLATFLPTLAVTVRRLRDAGFSWAWLLLPLPFVVPFVVGVAQLALALVDVGIDPSLLVVSAMSDPSVLQVLSEIQETAGAFLFASLSFVLWSVVWLLVNIVFEIFPSKSFEHGNKRVAPKGPETPAL